MPGKKTARSPAERNGQAIDNLATMVTRLHAKLEETHSRADALHRKAERLHSAIDELKETARNRPPSTNLPATQKAAKRRKAK